MVASTPKETAPRRPARAAGAALVLSLLACYGTLSAVAVLPLLGVAVAPDDTSWRVAIVGPAALVVAALARGVRRHGDGLPFGLALAGAALLSVLVFGHMNRVLEALAFVLLGSAVLAEWRRCARLRRHG